jgi:hypothetical protein
MTAVAILVVLIVHPHVRAGRSERATPMNPPMTFRARDLDLKEFIGDYCVSTVALSVEHFGGMWYETYIFPSDGKKITHWIEVWGTRYATRDEAVAGHAEVCERFRAGELEVDAP